MSGPPDESTRDALVALLIGAAVVGFSVIIMLVTIVAAAGGLVGI
ncbi:hypothetical protein [Sandaracinobacteroides saxicola]|nr:hypothetical protein [Sandaracinobacteroides saxicola]